MGIPLKVLIIEDSEDDTLLIVRELRKGGYEPDYERVETAGEMKFALNKKKWDIIISDYMMPGFNGLDALKLLQKTGIDLPFILVSGLISEETAVDAMKTGAHDYITKGNLSRLDPAVTRELREAEIRHDREHAREALKKSEKLYRTLFETTGTAIIIFEEDMTISLANKECENLSGYSREEIEGKKKWTDFIAKDDLEQMKEYHRLRSIDPHAVPKRYEFRLIDREGNLKYISLAVDIIPGEKKRVASLLDITEHRRAEEALQKSEKELKKRVRELEDFYNIAVGRELRMKKLKEEIEILREELKKYKAGENPNHE
jgi:PAS domain S-box-containing protein